MDPRSEVVIRQQDHLQGRVLFINAPNDQLLNMISSDIQASIWTWNYADFLAFKKNDFNVHFGIEFASQDFDQVVIFVPKSKELLHYILHLIASHFPTQSAVFLVGEKKGGVERAAKQLQVLGPCLKLDSARHCQFWQASLTIPQEKTSLTQWIKHYDIDVNGQKITVYALPGVFSQAKLDIGTAVLLPYLKQVKSGKIADFGCGAGVIACYLAKLNQQNYIYASDIDAFALYSTQLTFERNGIDATQFQLLPVANLSDLPTELDAIVSNPPFHQGIHTHYDASERLCTQSKHYLNSNGELWIVANRFLNYPILIEQHFGQCKVMTDQNGFKVLYACV
ncbi:MULTISPECIES: class I SAM-dependent methyltransferase [unclassified Acinetobacter]|uniref:class I SAM-dependent methyltransferase n=1 Tax=unclassified Acinetobacter TaxID=196816 RepID=UPI002934E8A5|nr:MULTISPECIES: class I SAM-dependent methyltransferase [unclassified Acinetobacter]WOE33034.1 class I SAM-dependent methyltransferase [Acinetobacter sp. SAAs470]WOE38512.1 class I SAM-dependent methyltransferase [Acinetobacter sp. SAAs474]